MLLTIVLVLAALTTFLYFWTRSRLLPGVISFEQGPFLGNWPALLRNMHRLYDWRLEHSIKAEAAGRECVQRAGPFLGVLEVHTPRMLQYLLHTNFDAFEKGDRFRGIFQDFLGNGIFNSDGAQWRSQRKIASHMFSAAKLNNHMLTVFTAHAVTVLDLLEEQRQKQLQQGQAKQTGSASSAPDCTIEMQSLFHRYTMDSIMHIGFGVQLDSLKSTGSPPPFVAAFDSMAGAIVMRFLGPPIKYKIQRMLGIKTEALVARALPVIDEFVYSICRARKQNQEALEHSGDLLSLFIADAAKGNLKMTTEHAGETSDLTDQDLRDIVLNFMLAGRDTTASLLTFLFYELSLHPAVEAKICEELIRVLGEPRDASHAAACEGFTHDSLKSLVYLEAVILETLRLHPPVAVDTKISNRATVFPDGTQVPKGMIVSYSPYIFGRLASIWGDDVLTFNPDRFLSAASADGGGARTLIQPSQYSFPQFNAGFRLCLGRGMAIMEAKVLTASILRAGFQLRARPDHDPAYKLTIILSMIHGLPMTVHRREE